MSGKGEYAGRGLFVGGYKPITEAFGKAFKYSNANKVDRIKRSKTVREKVPTRLPQAFFPTQLLHHSAYVSVTFFFVNFFSLSMFQWCSNVRVSTPVIADLNVIHSLPTLMPLHVYMCATTITIMRVMTSSSRCPSTCARVSWDPIRCSSCAPTTSLAQQRLVTTRGRQLKSRAPLLPSCGRWGGRGRIERKLREK